MSKPKRKRKISVPQGSVMVAEPLEVVQFSGFSGANYSPDRGVIFWPDMDTRRELDSFSRDELMRRIRWLCANEGLLKGIPKNAANLVGYQKPQAATPDEEWNELAEQAWRDSCMTPEVFDHGGKYDFEDAQLMLKRARYKDGDVLTVLSEWPNGRAKVAFYEAHQLRSPNNPPSSQKWIDGVLVGNGNRHLAYGVLNPDTNEVVVIPARDVIYSGEFESSGNIRAHPPLAHAVNHAVDITEVWANFKKAIKASSLITAVRELDSNAPAPRARHGLTGPPVRMESGVDGVNVEVSAVWNGGQIPQLPAGEKMKILTDQRPHPNVRELVNDLIRDICVGFGGLQPEVVWQMGRLSGPGVRFILDTADRWIKIQQRYDRRWCRRVWVYFIAKEIKAGRLRMPLNADGTPARWWAVNFTSQRNLTIDRTKESKSRLDEIEAGVSTWSGWDDIDGMFWKERTRQRVREVKYAMEMCEEEKVGFDVVFPRRQGAAAVTPNADLVSGSQDDEEIDEELPDE